MKLKYMLVFFLGFFSCAFLFYDFNYFGVDGSMNFWREIPFGTGLVSLNENVVAPSDWISEENILVFEDRIILRVSNATLSNYADSGSMKPVFDEGANGIRIMPENEEDVNVGDIISYRFGSVMIVHRVVEKGIDEEGVYFIIQGDNNILSNEKIRFKDIKYVTIGVLY